MAGPGANPHLLLNRTSISRSYVLLSKSGKALLIDYGYDMAVGVAYGTDHAGRRPWLYSIPALKAQFGVKRIDAALLTHFHDDHVAGLNMLREVEGTEVWAGENFVALLENPTRYDLPAFGLSRFPSTEKSYWNNRLRGKSTTSHSPPPARPHPLCRSHLL